MYEKLANLMMQDSPVGWFFILKKKKIPKDIKDVMEGMENGQISLIREAFEADLEITKIREFVKPKFDYYQMRQIYNGLKVGLSIDQVRIYAKPYFEAQRMKHIKQALQRGVNIDHVKEFAKPTYTSNQMNEIYNALAEGIPFEKVCEFVTPNVSVVDMIKYFQKLEKEYGIMGNNEQNDVKEFTQKLLKMLNE